MREAGRRRRDLDLREVALLTGRNTQDDGHDLLDRSARPAAFREGAQSAQEEQPAAALRHEVGDHLQLIEGEKDASTLPMIRAL